MNDKRHQELMWMWIFWGAAEIYELLIQEWAFLGQDVWQEGTGSILLSILEIHSEMVSGIKMERNKWKKMEELRVQ